MPYPHYGNQGGTPGASIRAGDNKLIQFFDDNHVELYNLKEDIGEDHNLSQTETEERDELLQNLNSWLEKVEAKIPKPNLDYEKELKNKDFQLNNFFTNSPILLIALRASGRFSVK